MTPAKRKPPEIEKNKRPGNPTQKAIDLVRLKAAVCAALLMAPDMPLSTAEAAAYSGWAAGTLTIWRSMGPGHGPEFIPGPRPTYTKTALDAFRATLPARRGSPHAGRPPKGGKRRAVAR